MARHLIAVQTFLFAALVLITALIAVRRISPSEVRVVGSVIRGGAAHAFESQYDERFPARTLGINVWAAIDFLLFHEGRPGVVLGREGWLYTDEEFKVSADSEKLIESHCDLIESVRNQLGQRNITLLVAVVPAKARIYSEYLGVRRPPDAHAGLIARIDARLSGDAVDNVDLYPALTGGKSERPTFLRTDTHWTPWGAELAARAIAKRVQAMGLSPTSAMSFESHIDPVKEYKGDLFSFLPLDPYFSWLLPRKDELAVPHTEVVGGNNDLFGETAVPDIVLVGTSYSANLNWNFSGYLKQALGEDVINMAEEGKGPFHPMLDFLRSDEVNKQPPRLVIWEVPERYVAMPDDSASVGEGGVPSAATRAHPGS